jgi:hypothetical protein
MTLGELFFEHQLAEAQYKECKSLIHVKTSNFSDNRPFFKSSLFDGDLELTKCLVLVDSGATSSFINKSFVRIHDLQKFNLIIPMQCQSFDGSLASSGRITEYIKGRLLIPTVDNSSFFSSVMLHVTRIFSSDIILGSSWLKDTNTYVGGTENSIVIKSLLQVVSSIKTPDASFLFDEYKDVFVTESLAVLPPHCERFDCEVNLKPNSIPPFGKMYNLSKGERDQLKDYIDENLCKGFIRVSSSPAAAPIFYVKVAGKADRPCVDYRILNGMTIRDS